MKHPRQAQVAWEISKIFLQLDGFLWDLYWDEFEKIYEREEAEKYWGSIILIDKHILQ